MPPFLFNSVICCRRCRSGCPSNGSCSHLSCLHRDDALREPVALLVVPLVGMVAASVDVRNLREMVTQWWPPCLIVSSCWTKSAWLGYQFVTGMIDWGSFCWKCARRANMLAIQIWLFRHVVWLLAVSVKTIIDWMWYSRLCVCVLRICRQIGQVAVRDV